MQDRRRDEIAEELVTWLQDGTARRIRETAGWSRERCASAMGMVRPMPILEWELGYRLPSYTAALKYHHLLTVLRAAPPAPKRDRRFDNRGAQPRTAADGGAA